MEDLELYERIVTLICDQMGIRDRSIELQTSLQKLGVDGDDAIALMSRFAEEFRVDMRHFNIKRHFGAEGLWLPGLWKKQMPVTISDLVEAAKSGVWPEQPK
jgi:hypothetical protein